MKERILSLLLATFFGLVLAMPTPVAAEDSSLPSEPQQKSAATEAVQPQVDEESAKEAVEKRKKIIDEAKVALTESHKAIAALEEQDGDAALASLEKATGKLLGYGTKEAFEPMYEQLDQIAPREQVARKAIVACGVLGR